MIMTAHSHALPESVRKRGILAILIANFFAWSGFFLVIPLVAIHYVDYLGWTAGAVGLLLAIRQFIQQSLTVLFGVVADRFGPKPLIASGMIVRAAGFVSMAFAESFGWVLAAMILAGIGGSLFEAPRSAALAYLSLPDERPRLYALMGVVGSVGLTAGTQLGALLIRQDFRTVCLVAGSMYIVIFLVIVTLMPRLQISDVSTLSMRGLARPLADRSFMLYLVFLSGHWFAWTQFSLTLTLAAVNIAGTDSAVAWIYAVNTIVTVGLGYTLPRFLERWCAPIDLLVFGTGVLALGLLMVGFATTTAVLLIAAAVFSAGAAIARPGQETVTANLAAPDARGTYFGVASLSLAVGGGLGNLVGGAAYDFGANHNAERWIWSTFAIVAFASALGIQLHRARFGTIAEPKVLPPEGIIAHSTASATSSPTRQG